MQDRVGPLKDVNGDIVTDDLGMCNILNNLFSSVFTCEDSTNVLPEVKQRYLGSLDGMLNDIDIDREKVLNKLDKLQVNKASGVDDIVPELLVKTSASLNVPLSIIFNHSFITGIVPDDWKKANVSAIFKKGEKENQGNYRPISLTSQVCKIFESMLRDSIVGH